MIRVTAVLPGKTPAERTYEKGITAEQILASLEEKPQYQILACRVNHENVRLDMPLMRDCTLEFLDQRDPYGNLVTQISLVLVYLKAVHDLYTKKTKVTINNSLSRGLFTRIHTGGLSDEDAVKIERRMRQIVKADMPIHEKTLNRQEAMEYLARRHETDTLKLFEGAPDLKEAYLCELGDESCLMYMHAVPSCGCLKWFEVRRYRSGMLLRFPHHNHPDRVPEYEEQKMLYDAFSEETQWDRLMGISQVCDLNRCIRECRINDLILLSEALHEKKIAGIAEQIRESGKRIVLIAGPSSSGKTTFAKRLCIQLRVIGLRPLYLGTDDYYRNRSEIEPDENGNRDYENLSAIDTELFIRQMNDLLSGKEADIPEYDFVEGIKHFGNRITSIRSDQPVVIEGIHALNPHLSEGIDDSDKFRIYISPLTQLNIDAHHRIPTTDARLFRRLVRDYRTRGRSAEETIRSWPSVREGEDRNIFPYNSEADAFFNSQCLYELAVLKKYAQPLLMQIGPDMKEYAEAQRFLKYLEFFSVLEDESAIANNSIIREFIGGSVLVS